MPLADDMWPPYREVVRRHRLFGSPPVMRFAFPCQRCGRDVDQSLIDLPLDTWLAHCAHLVTCPGECPSMPPAARRAAADGTGCRSVV